MYLGGKKANISNDLFIMTKIRMDHNMDASEIEGLLYKILSSSSFNNQRKYQNQG